MMRELPIHLRGIDEIFMEQGWRTIRAAPISSKGCASAFRTPRAAW